MASESKREWIDYGRLADLIVDKLVPQVLEKVEELLVQERDEMVPLAQVAEEKGLSRSFLLKNWPTMGGVKTGSKIYFSRRELEAMLRSGELWDRNARTKQDVS